MTARPRSRHTSAPQAGRTLFDTAVESPLLMLMDGHAMIHRAWHAIQTPLTIRRTGEEVRAVFGFANTFLKSLSKWNPTYCAIAFDLPGPTFRHRQYQNYKAHRPKTPPELLLQFDRVRELMRAFAVPIFEVPEYEADDILGTLCLQAENQGLETIILTGDTDTLQLVSPSVRVVLSRGSQNITVYDIDAVRERLDGLEPRQQPDLKALHGDPSDNIPGAPSVGIKTAIKLIQQFGDIDTLYQRIEEVAPSRLRETLIDHESRVRQGKELTTIVRDIPIQLQIEASRYGQYDRGKVLSLFREMEFTSLVHRVPYPVGKTLNHPIVEPRITHVNEPANCRIVATPEELASMTAELRAAGEFAFTLETTGNDPMAVSIVGLSFSCQENAGYYVPIGHMNGPQLNTSQSIDTLRSLLEDLSIAKTTHNANYNVTVLANYEIQTRNLFFDTMIASNLLGEKSISLASIAFSRLNVEIPTISSLIGTGKNQLSLQNVPVEEAAAYACTKTIMIWRLRLALKAELEQSGLWHLFTELEIPIIPVLVQMQRTGVSLDSELLSKMSTNLHQQIQRLEMEIYATLKGRRFNINSPSQLGEILFNEMSLPGGKKTKTGSYSTDAAVLEHLRSIESLQPEQKRVVTLVLEYRELNKLRSTYVDSLPNLLNPETGRLHTSYNQTGAATGRISSSYPNLQNIPVRTELGRSVRKAFVARNAPDWTLLAADYSQIELRVLAHFAEDEALKEAFRRNEDIHTSTASMIYNVPLAHVTSDMRRIAKVMNFGVIYGLTAFGISQQTELSAEEGAHFIKAYFGRFPGIQTYLDNTKNKARELGYVETILGRRRIVPELTAPNFQARQAAERMAVNMPIQGTAADIVKAAMIQLNEKLESEGLQTQMILQVHDELIFEVPLQEVESLRQMVIDIMPNALSRLPHAPEFSVPLQVDIKTGFTWGEMG